MEDEVKLQLDKMISTTFDQAYNENSNWAFNFSPLRINAEFSDFTFIIEGLDVEVHRCILATHSSVFNQQFIFCKKTEKSKVINDFSARTFNLMLDFMYTAKLPHSIALHEVFDLIKIAERYKVSTLSTRCKNLLINYIQLHPESGVAVYHKSSEMEAPTKWKEIIDASFEVFNNHLFERKLKARKTGTYHLLYIERVLHEKQEKDKIESEFQLESVGVQLESTCEVNSVFPSEHLEKEEDLNEMDDS